MQTLLSLSAQFHVDKKGRVNFAQTELLIHVVNRETNRILDVERYGPCPRPAGHLGTLGNGPSNPSLPRVIQMIDENKEQLRNLFRNYNVLDVQPAITARAPDDLSALQVRVQLGLEAVSLPVGTAQCLQRCPTRVTSGTWPPAGAGSVLEAPPHLCLS